MGGGTVRDNRGGYLPERPGSEHNAKADEFVESGCFSVCVALLRDTLQ